MKQEILTFTLFAFVVALNCNALIVSYSYNEGGVCISRSVERQKQNATACNGDSYDEASVSIAISGEETIRVEIVDLEPDCEYQFVICDVSGNPYLSGTLKTGLNEISTGSLSDGLYMLTVSGNDICKTFKFTKK